MKVRCSALTTSFCNSNIHLCMNTTRTNKKTFSYHLCWYHSLKNKHGTLENFIPPENLFIRTQRELYDDMIIARDPFLKKLYMFYYYSFLKQYAQSFPKISPKVYQILKYASEMKYLQYRHPIIFNDYVTTFTTIKKHCNNCNNEIKYDENLCDPCFDVLTKFYNECNICMDPHLYVIKLGCCNGTEICVFCIKKLKNCPYCNRIITIRINLIAD